MSIIFNLISTFNVIPNNIPFSYAVSIDKQSKVNTKKKKAQNIQHNTEEEQR